MAIARNHGRWTHPVDKQILEILLTTKCNYSNVASMTNVYNIDKGVGVERARQSKYPFRRLEVGDSFLIPGATLDDCVRAKMAAYQFARRSPGYKFAYTKEAGGLRVGRIAIETTLALL
jgi:hypothetical protein